MPISETQRVWRIWAFEADNRSWLFFFGCTGPPARLQYPSQICVAADPYNVASGPPAPVSSKTLSMPTDNGLGPDDGNGVKDAGVANDSRIHRSLNKDAPFHWAIERVGAITSRPVLGGLHHQILQNLIFGTHNLSAPPSDRIPLPGKVA
jgi:hypothetical protein